MTAITCITVSMTAIKWLFFIIFADSSSLTITAPYSLPIVFPWLWRPFSSFSVDSRISTSAIIFVLSSLCSFARRLGAAVLWHCGLILWPLIRPLISLFPVDSRISTSTFSISTQALKRPCIRSFYFFFSTLSLCLRLSLKVRVYGYLINLIDPDGTT